MKSFFVAICAAATLVAANCGSMRFQKPNVQYDAAYFTSLEKSVPALDLCLRMCADKIPTCPEHWLPSITDTWRHASIVGEYDG
ncbi:hypothetical protein BDN71DRAFT_1505131 [Pleurotus eryngii]|uniref:Secreted protein n=1 Tax=Pleurotus eryngii TaxID=5323 RepID=A0A9P6A148_PLEER|nr:hypothetical protein BDN71DRAFT_1505131 [Pleurotus eryngii]